MPQGSLQCLESPWLDVHDHWLVWNSKALVSIKLKWIWLKVWTDANWFSKHWVTISFPVLPVERRTHVPGRPGRQCIPYLPGQGSKLHGSRRCGGRRLVTHRFESACSRVSLFRQLTTASWTPVYKSRCQARVQSGPVWGWWSVDKAAGGRSLWLVGLLLHVRGAV